MELRARTLRVEEVTKDQIQAMVDLMERHYENVTEEAVRRDLSEKTWVILLEDGDELAGFSTQVVFEHAGAGARVLIVYSGDTIISPSHWGSWALPKAWTRLVLDLERSQPQQDLYWLLTTKGYKSYRFLPVFFESYCPCPEREPSLVERELVESLVSRRFSQRTFDPRNWTLAAGAGGQRLRAGVADIDDARRKDPHIRFFEARNPGHARGDELVCLARCNADNLKPFIVTRARRQ